MTVLLVADAKAHHVLVALLVPCLPLLLAVRGEDGKHLTGMCPSVCIATT